MISDTKRIIELFVCDCYTHGLHMELDDDLDVVYLSFWRYGEGWNSLWSRVRAAWDALMGNPLCCDLVYDKKSLTLIRDKMSEMLDMMK